MSDADKSGLQSDAEAGDDSYLASLSDLMVGMLFIFIIMLMAFALSYKGATDTAESKSMALECFLARNQQQLATLLGQITANVNKKLGNAVGVEVDPNSQALRMSDSGLFDSGRSDLRPQGRNTIRALALELNQLGGATQLVEGVYIEGHTDDVPVAGGSNWVLSTNRAIRTYQELILANNKLDDLRNAKNEKIFAVSGYGELRPIAPNTTPAGRAKNRRIDIRFALRVPTTDEVQNIMSNGSRDLDGCKGP